MRISFVFSLLQLKIIFKMWKTLLFLFFFPMLALACIGFICMHILSEEVRVEKFQVAIVDQDDTKATNFIIQHLMDNEEITKLSKFIQVKESIANELMEKNQIVAIISLPHGFTKNIIKGDNTPVPVIVNPRKPVQSMLVLQLLESATKFTSAAQSGINTIYHFLQKEGVGEEIIEEEFNKSIAAFSFQILGRGKLFNEEVRQGINQNLINYYITSFSVLLLMFWSFSIPLLLKGNMSKALQDRLTIGGITKLTEAATLITFHSIMIIFTIFLLFPISNWLSVSPVNMFIRLYFISLAFTFLFLFVDVICKNIKSYTVLGCFIILLGIIGGGHIIPTIYYPIWLENLGKWTVNYWAVFSLAGEISRSFALIIFTIIQLSIIGVFLYFQGRWGKVTGK
ncbi:ABC transporter permease [Caldibacillus thermoamylovorans]|uniref:ABC transporter permease n=1 Tax=Caldibacillus thermoamylovorans TaxID=35841 RepID=UPI002FD8CE24